MKILIFSEGGKEIGFGHLTRCIGLSQRMLEEEKGAGVLFIINDDASAKNLLKLNGFSSIEFDWQKDETRTRDLASCADYAIVDSYLADREIYDAISEETAGQVLMVDDYMRIEYPKGTVLSPSIYGEELTYKHSEGTTYLVGKDYSIQRRDFWDVEDKEVSETITSVLVTFGGIQRPEFIEEAFEYFEKLTELDFHIVLSENDVQPKELPAHITIYRNQSAGQMRDLMLKNDLCISGGGQTLYELARIGVPTIAICFANNQQWNVDAFSQRGFIEYVDWYTKDDVWQRITGAIETLKPKEERLKRKKIGQALVDGKGSQRITEYILRKKKDENYIKTS